MKQFTVIVPVYNEKSWIMDFLHSLYHQTRKPDEIIVVDGNSTDGTLEILEGEEASGKIKLHSFSCNIAQARNFAIKHAQHEIILWTDAGCEVDPHRCEELMKIYEHTNPAKDGAGDLVVGGKSDYIVTSEFQRFAKHRLVAPHTETPGWAGLKHFTSSRNVSFYKKIWGEVGGYPEYLTKRWEDTYFNRKVEKAGHKIHYCPTAIVKWWMWNSYKDFYKMYRNYTQGDAEIFMIHHIMQNDSLKQAMKFLLAGLFLLWVMLMFRGLSVPLIILAALIGIGLYKRSPWWFWFDLRFSLVKMAWMIVWMGKGIWKGAMIKSTIKK